MTRRRVLHLADSPYVGGVTSHILSVAEAFRDDPDWEIVLATLPGKRDDNTLFERAASAGFDVSTIDMKSTFDMQVRGRLRSFVDVNHIAIIHTHGYRANVIANRSRLTVPIVTTSHGLAVQPSLRLRLWQAMHLRFMRNQREVLACSNYVLKALIDRGVPATHLQVVYNGCSLPRYSEKRIRRRTYDFPGDKLLALYVGRLAPGKRVDIFLDALTQRNDYHGVIVGDGPMQGEFIRRAMGMKGASCSFLGAAADPTPFFHLADIVVLPTEMEALPMTLIEAAAYGKPVVASNVGGVPEVVEDGVTGLLVNDAGEWADALAQLSDTETRERMGNAARQRHREHFSLDVLRQSLAEVYAGVTAG